MTIFDMLDLLIEKGSSDLHIVLNAQPSLRIDGALVPIDGTPALTSDQTQTLIEPILTDAQKNRYAEEKEIDFGYQYKDQGRFRVNVYRHRDTMGAAMRFIPDEIKTVEELNLPSILHKLTEFRQGLVLVTGPTGEGKSTTLAALIDEINTNRAEHIVTIEDPIEFIHEPKKSIISQRELHQDTKNWPIALRSALREDPDVVLVGEMRDRETIESAIRVAETGHLVFATLHTSTAAQTIDRIIDVFPGAQQEQVRQELASSVQAVVSQRLLPRVDGGRVAAIELMFANPAIRNLIREQKTFQIDNSIQTSGESGMQLMETALVQLARSGQITEEEARASAFRPEVMQRMMGG